MFVDKWDNPSIILRSWCVFEILCAVSSGTTQLSAIMTPQEGHRLAEAMHMDPDATNVVLESIDASKSAANISRDMENIAGLVHAYGLPLLNTHIAAAIRNEIRD